MITAMVLAAGSSSRMGRSKQLLEIDGEKLLIRTLRTVTSSKVSNTLVVLGADEERHRGLASSMDVCIIHNPDWNRGMGSSIKAGLNWIISHKNPDAVIILVCDQPLLSADVINQLIDTHNTSGKAVIASEYSGVTGVPALFHRSYFNKLAGLSDEAGARKLIAGNPEVAFVSFPGGEIDLDTIDDYEAFIRMGSTPSEGQ